MDLFIDSIGAIRCLYAETIDLRTLGTLAIARASHVDADAAGKWWADLAPVSGPELGPFPTRSCALEAEQAWLLRYPEFWNDPFPSCPKEES